MASPNNKVILIEFNELTPSLVKKFAAAGQLPNFQKFHDESHVYVTDAEEEGELLNPWVQWVTVHTGMATQDHGVTHLSEGRKTAGRSVWDILSGAGRRVWICGSMNAGYKEPLNGFVLPDPWTTDVAPYPEGEFEPFYHFVSKAVQEHTNESGGFSKKDALCFMTFMARRGLSAATVFGGLRQLWQERKHNVRWKRAAIMDQLQWDVFRHYYRQHNPQFSTFFLNSTAHFQHSYWRHMQPEPFTVKPSEQDRQNYKDAILFGYQNMDTILGRIIKLAGPSTTLVFCTALSQQPYLKKEAEGGKNSYRLRDEGVLKNLLQIPGEFKYNPVMSEQFLLSFDDEQSAAKAQKFLDAHELNAEPAFEMSRDGNDIMVQCRHNGAANDDFALTDKNSNRSIPFFDVFYKVDVVKSAYHHPDGMLWVRYPEREHKKVEEKVSLQSIAPAVLEMLGVRPPEFMSAAPFTYRAKQLEPAVQLT